MKTARLGTIGLIALFGIALGVAWRVPRQQSMMPAGTGAESIAADAASRGAADAGPRVLLEMGGVSLAAELASDGASQSRGLSGRTELAPDRGMLFLFDTPGRHTFWMRGMLFPIDIFWIRDGVVVARRERLPAPAPGTPDAALPLYTPDADADAVLETVAGFAAQHGVNVGDRVTVREDAPPRPAQEF